LPLNREEEKDLVQVAKEYLDKAANFILKYVKHLLEISSKLVKQYRIEIFRPLLNILSKIHSYFHGKHQRTASYTLIIKINAL